MSTSNIQNYLSNVFQPAYRFNTTTGQFETVLNMYNINDLNVNSFNAGQFNVGDVNGNVYVGINAGNPASALNGAYQNVALGIQAGGGIANVNESVFIGYRSGLGASNISNVIAIGSRTVAGGANAIYIGISSGSTGSNNLFIGNNIAPGAVSDQLRIGVNSSGESVLSADLSLNRVGILTSSPQYPIDLNGYTYIRDGLGVAGTLNVSGDTTLSNVNITGAINVPGTTVFSNLATPGTLNVSGLTSLYSNLGVVGGANICGGLVSTSFMETKSDLYVRGASYQNFIQSDQSGMTGAGFRQHIALANVSGAAAYWLWTLDTFTGPLGAQSNGDFGITARQIDNVVTGATSRISPVAFFLRRSNGYVGLNTVTPSAGLHISRNVNFNFSNIPGILADTAHIVMNQVSNGNQRLAIGYNGSNTSGFIQAYTSGSGTNSFLINPNGGNVGINTISPAFTLDVSGTARITSNLNVSGNLYLTGMGGGVLTQTIEYTTAGTGTITVPSTGATFYSAYFTLIGGGGGGGDGAGTTITDWVGGGGGGAGYITKFDTVLRQGTTLSFTVGAGGAGGNGGAGGTGGTTTVGKYSAAGGTGGGVGTAGGNGGAGGNGSYGGGGGGKYANSGSGGAGGIGDIENGSAGAINGVGAGYGGALTRPNGTGPFLGGEGGGDSGYGAGAQAVGQNGFPGTKYGGGGGGQGGGAGTGGAGAPGAVIVRFVAIQ